MKKIIIALTAFLFMFPAYSLTEWETTCTMQPWTFWPLFGCATNDNCGINSQYLGGCSSSCNNLGECGTFLNPCSLNNETLGFCRCNEGYANCNINVLGCETDLRKDNNNCGECGTQCGLGNFCWNGQCKPIFNYETKKEFRGTCSIFNQPSCPSSSASALPNTCAWQGEPLCICNEEYANCDESIATGCETNIYNSISNCGSCGNLCDPGHTCFNGVCTTEGFVDEEGFGTCAEEEIDLLSNNDHCGSCYNSCPSEKFCWNGACIEKSSPLFYKGICENYESVCINSVFEPFFESEPKDSCEFNRAPKCACNDGFMNCDGSIITGCNTDIRKNINNCGACQNSCLAGEYCWQGTCIKINSASTYIQGSCSGTSSVCPAHSIVDSSGSFGPNTCDYNALPKCACEQGFVNNDNNAANGCELDLRVDRSNCGGIGVNCGDAPCISGKCGNETNYTRVHVECGFFFIYEGFVNVKPPYYADNELIPYDSPTCAIFNYVNKFGFGGCESGYKDCNNEAGGYDGCETPVSFNSNNCGECGNVCDSNQLCVNGKCVNDWAKCHVGCSCTDLFYQTAYIVPGKGSTKTYAPDAGSGANHDYINWANVQTCSCPWFGWGYSGDASCKCLPGYASCGNHDSWDGCETNILTNKLNCGSCGTTCYSLSNRCTGAVYSNHTTQAQIESICEVGCVNGACTKATKQGGYCQATSDCVRGTFQAEGSELQEGLYFFITSDGKDSIRTFNLMTPWNLTSLQRVNTATLYYNFDSTIDGFNDGYPRGFFLKNDGSILYAIEGNTKKVLQYDLSSAFNPATILSATKKSFDYSTQLSIVAEDLFIGNAGTKLYLTIGNHIFQYSINNWDISTAIYDNKAFNTLNYDSNPTALFFNNDGTKLYILGSQNNAVFQFSLSTAWDVSTATIDTVTATSETISFVECPEGQVLNPNDNVCVTPVCMTDSDCSSLENPNDICHNDGRWDSACINNFEGYPGDDPEEAIIIPPTETIAYNVFVSINDAEPQSIFFSNDGLKLFAIGSIGEKVMSWDLSTAWDLKTAIFSQNNFANIKTYSTKSTGLSFSPDGTKMFVTGDGGLYDFANIPALGCTGGIEESPGLFNKWCCPPDKCGFNGTCKDNNEGLIFNNINYFCNLGEWKEVSANLDLNLMIKSNHAQEISPATNKLYLSDAGVSQSCNQDFYRECTASSKSYAYKYCFDYNVVFDGIFNIETTNYVPVKVIEQSLHNPYFKPEIIVDIPEKLNCDELTDPAEEGVMYCGQI